MIRKNTYQKQAHNKSMNTKKMCSLQIKRQMELNLNQDMDMYVGSILTEKELKEKTKTVIQMLESHGYTKFQTNKIRKWLRYTLKKGWFDRFMYRGFIGVVSLDESGKWRLFVKYNNYAQRGIKQDHYCDCYECGHDYSDRSFRINNYPLRLWDYGDKIGLDQFIGLSVLSFYGLKYDYLDLNKRQRKVRNKRELRGYTDKWQGTKLVNIDYAKLYLKKLIDSLILELENRKIPLGVI